MTGVNWIKVLAALAASHTYAQDISGDWQGSLKVGPQELRMILRIARTDSGEWKASMLSIFSKELDTTKIRVTLMQSTADNQACHRVGKFTR
jgi:hypothetical protein